MRKAHYALSFCCWFIIPFCHASESVINTEDRPEGKIYLHQPAPAVHGADLRTLKKEEQQLLRLENKLHKLVNANAHHAGLFNDPVNKWFWLWIISWGAGIAITLLSGGTITAGVLGIVWLTSFIVGSIGLIVWLVKKFG